MLYLRSQSKDSPINQVLAIWLVEFVFCCCLFHELFVYPSGCQQWMNVVGSISTAGMVVRLNQFGSSQTWFVDILIYTT